MGSVGIFMGFLKEINGLGSRKPTVLKTAAIHGA
ncbi:hypothetical protein ABIC41_006246 [Variovorax sp. 1128]